MAKKTTATAAAEGQNLKRLSKALDPDSRKALNAKGRSRIEKLSEEEVEALITAHKKLSPGKKWQPDPDGSIF